MGDTLSKVNKVLGITESYKAPERIMQMLFDPGQREKMFFGFMDVFNHDLSSEWFYQYFEDEHADRKNRGQDFTPESVSKLTAELLSRKAEGLSIIEEPAAGCGSMVIQHWNGTRKGVLPWDYRPDDYLYILGEKTSKTIPFLLLNLMIRGMNAIVIHGDSLTREAEDIYWICNEANQAMCFSDIYKAEHTERIAEMFDIKWTGKRK